MMRDELSHRRTLELAQAHSSSTTNPVPMVSMVGHFKLSMCMLLFLCRVSCRQ